MATPKFTLDTMDRIVQKNLQSFIDKYLMSEIVPAPIMKKSFKLQDFQLQEDSFPPRLLHCLEDIETLYDKQRICTTLGKVIATKRVLHSYFDMPEYTTWRTPTAERKRFLQAAHYILELETVLISFLFFHWEKIPLHWQESTQLVHLEYQKLAQGGTFPVVIMPT